MSEPVGKKLKEARLKRGLSIEDIAHETKIPARNLQSLEDDDYSAFPHPTYAKSFLQIYGDYLEVDVSEMVAALSGPKTKGLGSRAAGQGPPPIDLTPQDSTIPIFKLQEERKSPPSLIFFSLIVALVVALPTVYLVGKRSGFQAQAGEQLSRAVNLEAAPDPAGETASQVSSQEGKDAGAALSYEPPPPMPDAEFNKLIGIDPPASGNLTPTGGESSLPVLNPESDLDNP